jgi:hypothetical protein
MDKKAAVVLGFFLVLASAIVAFGPRFAPSGNPGNIELAQVKEELAQVKDELVKLAQVKDELAKLRASVSTTASGGKSADLKWARSIAEDFLRAVDEEKWHVADELLMPDYRDRITAEFKATFRFEVFASFLGQKGAPHTFFHEWSITGEELAPNGLEAKFTGKVSYDGPKWNFPFTLRTIRAKDSELWRVSLFSTGRRIE